MVSHEEASPGFDDFAKWLVGNVEPDDKEDDLLAETVQAANPQLTALEVDQFLPHRERELLPFLPVQLQLLELSAMEQELLQREQQLNFMPAYALQLSFDHQLRLSDVQKSQHRKFLRRSRGTREFSPHLGLTVRFEPASVSYPITVSVPEEMIGAGTYHILVPFTPRGTEDLITAELEILLNSRLIKRVQANFHVQEG